MLRAAGFAAVLVASLLDAAVGQLRECDRRALAEPKSFELPTGEYPPPWKLEFEKSSTFQATQDAARGHINYRFDAPFVVTEHRLLFCKVAKVASSGWLRLLRRLSGDEGWRGNPYFIDKEHGWVAGVRQLAHLEHADALATLRDRANWTRIVVVRDPAERLLSAFLDKIHRHDDSSTQLARYSSELFGLPESEFANETFADFVERVAYGLAHSVVDQHWSPLADNCDMRTWLPAYDLVIRYQHGDDMNVLLDCVLATVARRSRDPAALTKMRNTFDHTSADAKKHGTNAEMAYYTPKLLRRVMNMYAEDYALFGLPTPDYLLRR